MHRCGLAAEVSKLNFLDGLETMLEIFETQERMTAGKVGALPVPSSANTVLFCEDEVVDLSWSHNHAQHGEGLSAVSILNLPI